MLTLTKKEIYKKAMKELENRRVKTRIRREQNLKTVFAVCPEIIYLNEKLKKTSIKLIKSTFNNHKENNMEVFLKIQNENIAIQQKIKTLLKYNKYPEDFLKSKPYCKNCNDYGVKNNDYCECFKLLMKKIAINELRRNSTFKLTNFENFNLNFYSKERKTSMFDNGKELNEYDCMYSVVNRCKNFSKNFPKVPYGLIMQGNTGLGKTHLSMAIASVLISRGFSVIYATASELTKKFSDYYFNREKVEEFNIINTIIDCDLLIIDDLGSEPESKFNLTAIFEIVNSRTNLKKPMILSTNLNSEELPKRYDERIFSRISANLKVLEFFGKDNRHKQETQKYGV